MTPWSDCKPQDYETKDNRIYKSDFYDRKFREINLQRLPKKYRDMIISIKSQYDKCGSITVKQASVISDFWSKHRTKKKRISAKYYWRLPSVVHEQW